MHFVGFESPGVQPEANRLYGQIYRPSVNVSPGPQIGALPAIPCALLRSPLPGRLAVVRVHATVGPAGLFLLVDIVDAKPGELVGRAPESFSDTLKDFEAGGVLGY